MTDKDPRNVHGHANKNADDYKKSESVYDGRESSGSAIIDSLRVPAPLLRTDSFTKSV